MNKENIIYQEIKGLYKIIPLTPFRETTGVSFHIVPKDLLPRIDGIDRVIHKTNAISPGPVGDVEHPWYMHPCQEDNLIVLNGNRHTELYTPAHGAIENFEVTPDVIKKDGEIVFEGPAMLTWPCFVFHRIRSCGTQGSASVNFAVRNEGFDIKTNFSIYDVDINRGSSKAIRKGHLDQFGT